MADDVIAGLAQALADRWQRASRNPNLTSSADVLRPPYASPLPWVDPVTAPAARDLSVGFAQLPPGYQRLLGETQAREKVSLGSLPGYSGVQGQYLRRILPGDAAGSLDSFGSALQAHGIPLPTITVDKSSRVVPHELIHAWLDQSGREYHPSVEEQLARHIAGNKSAVGNRLYGSITPQHAEDARKVDQYYTNLGSYQQPWRGLVNFFFPLAGNH